MSMLAENRRKSKWVINPTKKPIWSTDSNGIKFGKQLMEKMGWSAGKGLGLNEQGIQEPLKVSFKNDTKGMGFKGNDDDWIEHQDEFNILLNQLRSNDDSSTVNNSTEKNEIKSLEEKSKQSKARVHYQKFTRGKDLSKYSENDLACILGTAKTKKKDIPKTEEVIQSEPKSDSNFETSFGVTTINSGSINDYFKKKWMVKPSAITPNADEDEDEEENFRPSFSTGKPCFSLNDENNVQLEGVEEKAEGKKHKSMPEKESLSVEENRTPELDETGNTEKVKKKKRKKQEVENNSGEEEPKSKKRRKNSNENGGPETSSEEPESLLLESENNWNSSEEKKKEKNQVKLDEPADEIESRKEKKRRKRNVEEVTNEGPEPINDRNDEVNAVEEESSKRKKKKKDKKEKVVENEVINSGNQPELSNGDVTESYLEVESVKNKKKKKHKLEKTEEIVSNIQDTHSTDRVEDWEVGNMEKVGQGENTLETESGKKRKKKKDKKEKLEECDNNSPEVSCTNYKNSSSLSVGGEIVEISEEVELELGKKKKKKRMKKEKPDEIEKDSTQIVQSHLEEMTTGETVVNYTEEPVLEDESVKKKKKKKDKKEKIEENERINKESSEEKIEEECILDVELVEKKKKKKHKKEKREENEGSENKEEQVGKDADLAVTNNEVNGLSSSNAEGQERLQKLRDNLFPDKAADKYFPGQGTNERVLKLIRWANIEEFKGSNLSEVEGYGRRKLCQKQSR